MKAQFEMMAAYNAWANRRLYAAAARLDEEDYRADLGAFFCSVHGTLNHLIVGDMIWMARFRGDPSADLKLDDIIYHSHEELRVARLELDEEIVLYFTALPASDLEREFTYTPITLPDPVTQSRAPAMAHFFNHQTHHRGQVHALLTRLTGEAPPLDLLYYLREVD